MSRPPLGPRVLSVFPGRVFQTHSLGAADVSSGGLLVAGGVGVKGAHSRHLDGFARDLISDLARRLGMLRLRSDLRSRSALGPLR